MHELVEGSIWLFCNKWLISAPFQSDPARDSQKKVKTLQSYAHCKSSCRLTGY